MACTKIFSGDLPEIINEIIQYFRNDFPTLHSCILVNRLWCRLAIPLLWENPFSKDCPKNYHFIEIYLYNLNDDDKIQLLNKYGINNNLFPSNTLFNYSSFIQHLNMCKFIFSTEEWVATIVPLLTINNTQILDFKKFICKSLIKIFNENGANLHTLEIMYIKMYNTYDTIVSELISEGSNFICNIRNLHYNFTDSFTTFPFLNFLNSNCNSISSFRLIGYNNNIQKFEKILCNIVDSQQNIKKISLRFNSIPLYRSLLSLKNSNLKTIIFFDINFKTIVVPNEIFKQLNGLESIHILYCDFLNSEFIQQIINSTEPFKLRSLFINEQFLIEPLQLLLQKSGDYLENFGFIPEEDKQELFELLMKYCSTKIKFLSFLILSNQNIYRMFQLIENVESNLNYLDIETYEDNLGSIILQNLGQILPFKLEYLNLSLKITNTRDFEVFINNSQNTFIKKLLIEINMKEIRGDEISILSYIKEYIMKKKRCEYLAFIKWISDEYHEYNEDLYSLKDEVKEFRLHNIIIQDYNDLYISIGKFAYEMY